MMVSLPAILGCLMSCYGGGGWRFVAKEVVEKGKVSGVWEIEGTIGAMTKAFLRYVSEREWDEGCQSFLEAVSGVEKLAKEVVIGEEGLFGVVVDGMERRGSVGRLGMDEALRKRFERVLKQGLGTSGLSKAKPPATVMMALGSRDMFDVFGGFAAVLSGKMNQGVELERMLGWAKREDFSATFEVDRPTLKRQKHIDGSSIFTSLYQGEEDWSYS
ncbi:hypothetical protein BC829DRAFT_259204 [Chytridium lagenaria]|nr:hypothetical protein BC829DRAFT_259204 [Chytridium lagenaria]